MPWAEGGERDEHDACDTCHYSDWCYKDGRVVEIWWNFITINKQNLKLVDNSDRVYGKAQQVFTSPILIGWITLETKKLTFHTLSVFF